MTRSKSANESEFVERGWVKLSAALPVAELFAHAIALRNACPFRIDRDVPGACCYYKERTMEQVMRDLLPTVEAACASSSNLLPTYSYLRVYEHGDTVNRHVDRRACEFAVSLALGPERGRGWPLHLLDRQGNHRTVELAPGDALVFAGSELPHWREPNPGGVVAQLLCFYVAEHGSRKRHRDDRWSMSLSHLIARIRHRMARRRFERALEAMEHVEP